MPGRRLNDTELNLMKWWDNLSVDYPQPMLKSISIKGIPGLRGITELDISFNYPLTVICGQNGSGKTTLLGLSALAFHSPDNHHSYQARNYNKKKLNSYYTFMDFFFKGNTDPDITGVEITWNYDGGALHESRKTKTIRKQTNKWMKYKTRPKRSVHYFGASRVLPAIEKNVLRGQFRVNRSQHKTFQLNDDFRDIFCEILGRKYSAATVIQSEKYSLQSCEYVSSYTSFNMGAGEDILLELLYYIQEAPKGSLIVIEEIELGLHPEAQRKFAKKLLEITLEKKFQVIVSSHSYTFIDNVPQKARIFIQRIGVNTHNVLEAPTTRYAMGFLQGETLPELIIYCEDSFAERIINKVLKSELRKRINCIGISSSWDQVIKQCIAHVRASWDSKYLGVLDGDVSEHDLNRQMKNDMPSDVTKINCCRLYDDLLSPEEWVLQEIFNNDDRIEMLKDDLGEDNIETVRTFIEKLRTLPESHDIGFEFVKMTGLRKKEAEDMLIKSACKGNEKLNPLIDEIRQIIDRESG